MDVDGSWCGCGRDQSRVRRKHNRTGSLPALLDTPVLPQNCSMTEGTITHPRPSHKSPPHQGRCDKCRRLVSCSRISSDSTKVTRVLVASSDGRGLGSRQAGFPITRQRYSIRIPTSRRVADVNKEKSLWVHSFRMPPDGNNTANMEGRRLPAHRVRIRNVNVWSPSQQDTNSTYSQSAGYHLKDAIVRKACFLLVRRRTKRQVHGVRSSSSRDNRTWPIH